MMFDIEITSKEVTFSLLTLAIVFVFIRALGNRNKKHTSPPGPWPFPIIGNLLQLGDHPYLTFMEMRKKYGDVFLIKLGMVPVVVVNGAEMVKKGLLKDGEDFAGRPHMHTFSFFADGKSLSFSVNYGESWKLHKKIAINALRSFSKAEAKSSTCSSILEEHVTEEVSELVKVFKKLSSKQGSFDPKNPITSAVANIVCALCFGKRYDHFDEEFLRVIKTNEEFLKASSAANPADFIPCFRYLPLRIINAPREFYHQLNQFVKRHVQDHITTYDKNHLRDITDALVSICHDKNARTKAASLSDNEIINTVCDIFGAGFETVSAFLNWSFLYLIYYPEIQTKIHEEIDENIGLKPPRFEDRKNLPYTEAFINEIFRHTTFIPFTIPHCATTDTTLNGYFIPQKTCVFFNMYQVNHDETVWENPDSFQPERFLNESGKLNKSVVEKVLIFGMGIRKCLGEDVARNEIFVFIASILQQLKLKKCPGSQLDLTPTYGLVMKNKPFQLTVEPRILENS